MEWYGNCLSFKQEALNILIKYSDSAEVKLGHII
jgi:hypothetical protein